MSVHQEKRTGSWFVRYRDDLGKQKQLTFGKGEENHKKAQIYDLQVQAKKYNGEPLEEDNFTPETMYADQLANLWYKAKRAEGCEDWLYDWGRILNKKILSHICKVPICKLDQVFLVNLIYKKFTKISQTTRNRYLSYLKIMFNWGIKHDYITKNPLARWQKQKEVPRRLNLTAQDLQKIYDVAPEHIRWIIDICINLGVRPGKSELLSLKWNQVDWEGHTVLVYASKTKSWRTIPVRPEFMEKLKKKKQEARTEYIIEFRGKPIERFNHAFRRACVSAGFGKEFVAYHIRHLFATSMLANGGDPVSVSMMMGHSSTKMTLDQYGHVLQGAKEQAVKYLPTMKEKID